MAATGFISRTITRIRTFAAEPETNAKYTDAILLDMIEISWAEVMAELNRASSTSLCVRHDISAASATTGPTNTYLLPPTIHAILRLAKVNTTTGVVEWEEIPRSRWSPAGPGFLIEGNTVRFEPHWQRGTHTLRLTYIPSGDMRLHYGTVDGTVGASAITNDTSANTCTVVLAATPTTGSLDTRPNAYAGSILRILGDGGTNAAHDYCQERVITAYDVVTRTATMSPALTTVPVGDAIPYEVAPLLGNAFDAVIAMDVAAQVVGIEGDGARSMSIERQFARKMRTLKLNAANQEAIVGQRFQHDTTQGMNFASW